MKSSYALITVGCGFIGSHLTETLLQSGIRVKVLDDLSIGRIENLPREADCIHGDITDAHVLQLALKGVDTVIHLAARVSIRDSFRGLSEDVATNVLGTAKLLQALDPSSIKKFIFASSMAVYGHAQDLPIKETHPLNPMSPYGISKSASEAYITNYCAHLGIQPVILRYFNTFGPRQTLTPYVGVIRIFISNALRGKPLTVFGDGRQQRDFISVHDVSQATLKAVDYSGDQTTFNIGTGIGTDVNTLAARIRSYTNSASDIQHLPPQAGEPRDSIADTTRMIQGLGFAPKHSLEQKLPELIAWIQQERH